TRRRSHARHAGRLSRWSRAVECRARSAARRDRYAHGAPASRDGCRPAVGTTELPHPRRPRQHGEPAMKRTAIVAGLVAAAFIAGGYGLYRLGMTHGMGAVAVASAASPASASATGALPQGIAEGEEATRRHMQSGLKAGDTDPATGRKILYYHDPMVPGNKFD